MATQSDVLAGHPQAELIAGLREVADWLSEHPGLPRFSAYLGAYPYSKSARAEMTALASALGDRATETLESNRVSIKGEFGPVVVGASTPAENLGAKPAPPLYKRILPGLERAA